jgi:hypothetical protein
VQKAAPPAAVMPTIVDDQATVRWGDVVTIPVLDNDSMADGVPLKLTPSTVKVVVGKGEVYASGQVLRYLPDPDPITAEKVVTLEYAAYPEGMPERSVTGRVTVTVKPPPTPQTPDQPPTARNFSGIGHRGRGDHAHRAHERHRPGRRSRLRVRESSARPVARSTSSSGG